LGLNPLIFKGGQIFLQPLMSPSTALERLLPQDGSEDLSMKTVVKMLVVLGFGAALAGCVVAPYGRPRAYVVAPAPVVVVRPCCYR
jgi:hypothetical protein